MGDRRLERYQEALQTIVQLGQNYTDANDMWWIALGALNPPYVEDINDALEEATWD